MTQRERILAGVVLLLVAGWGAKSLYGRYQRAIDLRASELADAQEELALVQHSLRRGERAVRQMEQWRERSLPDDREKADSLYKAWLTEKAKRAGLTVTDINPAARSTPPSAPFTPIGYRIEASGSLSSVTAMLYEFYKSPQLHQIRLLRLLRPQGREDLQVSLEAEALILPGSTATDSLPEGESKRLRLASLADYQKTFSERELTNVYTPPRPPVVRRETPTPPEFDDSEQARFTGSVGSNDGQQAWINVQTTGEVLRVSAGDPVKVGTLEGLIVSVEPRSLVFESDGKKFRVAVGEYLRKGKELEADGKAASDVKQDEPKS